MLPVEKSREVHFYLIPISIDASPKQFVKRGIPGCPAYWRNVESRNTCDFFTRQVFQLDYVNARRRYCKL